MTDITNSISFVYSVATVMGGVQRVMNGRENLCNLIVHDQNKQQNTANAASVVWRLICCELFADPGTGSVKEPDAMVR